MPPREEVLNKIIDEIFSFETLKIERGREQKIKTFIDTTVNGDIIKKHIVINASINKDNQGILIYILTNNRIIKMIIDSQEISSSSYFLNSIIGFERKLIDDDRAAIEISLQNGFFGLRYSSNNQKINDFFQEVDQSRALGFASHA